MTEIRINSPLQVTEDGSIVFRGVMENPIKKHPDGSIEGLTVTGQKIICDYDLNGSFELLFRNKLALLQEHQKYLSPQLRESIGYFCNALRQIANLNRNSHKHTRKTDNLLRTILYANVITALESFFSDYLIGYILIDDIVLNNLGKNYESFKSEKYSLRELIAESKNAKELAIEKLKETVFHNLNTVKSIYTAAFGIYFPKFSGLAKAIENRHDIVHRNGYKKDAKEVEEYSKDDVLTLLIEAETFVLGVLEEIKKTMPKAANELG